MDTTMAGAPLKTGLDYFPLNVDFCDDDKIALIEAKYPDKGFEIIIKLLMKIYKEGYYYSWTEREQLLYTRKVINVDINMVVDVINDSVNWDLFNQQLYKKYTILTSRGIQKRYLIGCKRRKQVEMIKEYTLIDINDYIKPIIVCINLKKVDNKGQSKVEKSKVEKSNIDIHSLQKFINNNLPNVSKLKTQLTENNCISLLDKYSEELVKRTLESMDNYKPLTQKYVSVYQTCDNWCERDFNNGNGKHEETGSRPPGVEVIRTAK